MKSKIKQTNIWQNLKNLLVLNKLNKRFFLSVALDISTILIFYIVAFSFMIATSNMVQDIPFQDLSNMESQGPTVSDTSLETVESFVSSFKLSSFVYKVGYFVNLFFMLLFMYLSSKVLFNSKRKFLDYLKIFSLLLLCYFVMIFILFKILNIMFFVYFLTFILLPLMFFYFVNVNVNFFKDLTYKECFLFSLKNLGLFVLISFCYVFGSIVLFLIPYIGIYLILIFILSYFSYLRLVMYNG